MAMVRKEMKLTLVMNEQEATTLYEMLGNMSVSDYSKYLNHDDTQVVSDVYEALRTALDANLDSLR